MVTLEHVLTLQRRRNQAYDDLCRHADQHYRSLRHLPGYLHGTSGNLVSVEVAMASEQAAYDALVAETRAAQRELADQEARDAH